jgi:hypothetical protein
VGAGTEGRDWMFALRGFQTLVGTGVTISLDDEKERQSFSGSVSHAVG